MDEGSVSVTGPPSEGEGEDDWEAMSWERREVVVCSSVCRAEVGALGTCWCVTSRNTQMCGVWRDGRVGQSGVLRDSWMELNAMNGGADVRLVSQHSGASQNPL